jgi:hypothetical protein
MLPVLEGLHARTVWYVAWGCVAGTVILIMVRPSRVHFVDSHERSKLSTESRKGWVKAIFLVLLGASAGKLIEHIVKVWLK